MLVRFHSKAAAGVTMFGYIAVDLLRLMGMSGNVPGAVLAAGVPEARQRLRTALESSEGDRVPRPATPDKARREDDEEERAPGIDLRTRGYPLIQLLEAAAAEDCDVVWEDADRATG